jgi:hypothetical protein
LFVIQQLVQVCGGGLEVGSEDPDWTLDPDSLLKYGS